MKSGIEIIAAERHRQIREEGFVPDNDLVYECGELSMAAACYALNDHLYPMGQIAENRNGVHLTIERKAFWPFAKSWWKPALTTKPEERIKELAKSGALIAAEIDRLNRVIFINSNAGSTPDR